MRNSDEIRRLKANADLLALMGEDGHKWVKEGGRHRVCCPFHRENTPSCIVDPDNRYHCFGCGADGDVVEYLRKYRHLTFDQAIAVLGHCPPRTEPARIHKRRVYHVIMPVPANAPRCAFNAYSKPGRRVGAATAVWWYLSPTGEKLLAVTRHPRLNDDGTPLLDEQGHPKKDVRTWSWARNDDDGSIGWECTRPETHLPLYGLDRLAAKPDAPVIIVEGEKCADAAHEFLPFHACVSWCGGAANVKYADKVEWSPLRDRDVILWPDYDQEGAAAMLNVARYLRDLPVRSLKVIDLRRLANRPRGWDIADGTREDAELVLEFAV